MLRMVAVGNASRIPPKPLHVMDIGYVDLDEFTPCLYVVRRKSPATGRGMKTSVQAFANGIGEELDYLLNRTVPERRVGSGNCRAEIATRSPSPPKFL